MKNISSCRFVPVLRALLFGLSTVFLSARASGDVQPAAANPSSPSAITPNWSETGFLIGDRYSHTATLLNNGKVLVAGGHSGAGGAGPYLRTAELYDPATGLWSATGQLTGSEADHTATLLPNGKVLVVGFRV